MIAKLFKRNSYVSLTVTGLLLSLVAYNYSNLTIIWLSFQAKSLNFLLILATLIITIRAIGRVFQFIRIDTSSNYYMLMYPLILLAFPVESVDLRLLLCPAFFFSGWSFFRQYIENKNAISSKRSMVLLFDSILLVSLSSILFIEHLLLLLFLLPGLVFSKKSINLKELGVFIIIPVLLFFTTYNIFLLFDVDALFFSSFISLKNLSFSNQFSLSFIYHAPALLFVFVLFTCSLLLLFRKKVSHDIQTLDYDGLFYFGIVLLVIAFINPLSGLELHYLSLPLTYYIYHLFLWKKDSYFANFILISLIINVLLFTFVLN